MIDRTPLHPDFREALLAARSHPDPIRRDEGLENLALLVLDGDRPTTMELINELPVEHRTMAWWRVCTRTFLAADIAAGLLSLENYVPRNHHRDDPVMPGPWSRDDLTVGFAILQACTHKNVEEAERLLSSVTDRWLQDTLYHLIAERCGSEYSRLILALRLRMSERPHPRQAEFARRSDAMEIRLNPVDPERVRNRITAVELAASKKTPGLVFFMEVILLATAGGVEEALRLSEARLEELDHPDQFYAALAIGSACLGELDSARGHASRILDPELRYQAYAHIYAAVLAQH